MPAVAVACSKVAADALAAVNRIDLTPINEKLTFEDPEDWTTEAAVNAEANYRRFLALHLMHPFEVLVPDKIIDKYWHQHILDTRKYADDCEKVFGSFLHHDPYFGIGGEKDRDQNLEAFAVTQRLWEEAFGVSLLGQSNPCSSTDCR